MSEPAARSDAAIAVTVNGEPRTIAADATVATLLAHLGLAGAPCAVEVNRDVAPKATHPTHMLADGDVIEIVTLVGGG